MAAPARMRARLTAQGGGGAAILAAVTPRLRLTSTLSFVLSSVVACGGGGGKDTTGAPVAAKPAETSVEKPTESGAKPAEAAAAPKKSAREKALAGFDAGAAKAQATAFREHLAAGRKAVKAKDYAAGIAAFEAALTIDANNASALGELGWAAYNAGDLDKAERFTRQAITAASQDKTRGAVLYNLGRILEDRGQKDEAAVAYQRSLQLRPNDTVSGRLTALQAGGAAVEDHGCDLARREGSPPQDLCKAFAATLTPDELFESQSCLPSDVELSETVVDAAGVPYGGEPRTKIALDLGDGARVTTFGVERMMTSGGGTTEVYLAVLFGDRWFTTLLGAEYNPGVGYIGESLVVDSITAQELVGGGRPEVVVTFTWDHHDGDYGDNVMEGETEKVVAVLGLDGDAPRWLGAFSAASSTDVGPMLEGEPSEVTPSKQEKKVEYRFGGGAVEIGEVAGSEPSTKVGRFELGALPAACPGALNYVI